MRLWHEALIPYLPRQQLLGQHRECCALRGNGWGKPNATVNYVFKHHPIYLAMYHTFVMNEMLNRGYSVETEWKDPFYRGKSYDAYEFNAPLYFFYVECIDRCLCSGTTVYKEHDDDYLRECLNNLRNKGIILEGFDYERVEL